MLPLKSLLQYAEETKLSDLLRMESYHEQEYASLLKTQTENFSEPRGDS